LGHMSEDESAREAVEVLQQLGLKEYEAKCFVGLSRLPSGTAKQLSEVTDVPRTRIYDAIRVLEAQGLVEIQHTSPQQFRAVPLEEATETLRDQYEDRVERLGGALSKANDVRTESEETAQEVWSLSGSEAVANRAQQLIGDADEEVLLVLGHESLLTEELVGVLNDAGDADLLVGAVSESLETAVTEAIPAAETFVSGLDWMRENLDDHETAIGRLLLVDRSSILVSTFDPDTGGERAVFGGGFRNGLVVIARRLMAQGFVEGLDASQ
jgi:sugar-specific transcriptional regulator TrmB